MIVYKRDNIENLKIQQKAKFYFAKGWLSAQQMQNVHDKFPVKHFIPNVFVRIGLFLFMTVLVMSALGFFISFSMLLFSSADFGNPFWMLTNMLFSGLCFFFLEKFIVWRNWYGNGMDDALLYAGIIFLTAFWGFLMSDIINEYWFTFWICFCMLPFILYASFRYLDRLLALTSVLLLYLLMFILITEYIPYSNYVLPFSLMLFSAALLAVINKLSVLKKFEMYHQCFNWQKTLVYLFMYAAGNYFVIREGGNEWLQLGLEEGEHVPLAWFFLCYTAFLPFIYLYVALTKKHRSLLWVSLCILAISVITFKYYFSLGHPEITLSVAGIVMIGVAYFSIKALIADRFGLSFKQEPDENAFLKSQAEALLLAQTFGKTVEKQVDEGVSFGEGDFGGAGSGGKY